MFIYAKKSKKPQVIEKEIREKQVPVVDEKNIEAETKSKNSMPKKKNNKKIIPTPVIVEEIPVVVEEKTEDEDLSQWLEEHTED